MKSIPYAGLILYILLTIVWLIPGTSALCADMEYRYNYPGTTTDVFFRFKDDQQDEAWISSKNGEKGSWIKVHTGQIQTIALYKNVDRPKRRPNRVQIIEENQDSSGYFEFLANGMLHIVIPQTDKPVVFRSPIPSDRIVHNSWSYKTFGNDNYLISSVKSPKSEGTWVIRASDGKSIKVDDRFRNLGNKKIKVEEGILKTNLGRDIDLLAFDVEATFQGRGRGIVADTEGKLSNAVSLVDRFFEDFRSRGEVTIPLIPADQERAKKIGRAVQRKNRSSIVILGESGTGKTTLVKTALKDLPRTWRVKTLDASTLNSGASRAGVIEKRAAMMIAASEVTPIIWFADEIHSLRGIGTHSENSNDVFEYWKRALADGTLKFIGTDTPTEFDEKLNDPAIQRRFERLDIPEPTKEELLLKVDLWLSAYGYNKPTTEVLEYLFSTVDDFNGSESEPSRSIGLLEVTFALLDGKDLPVTIDLVNKAAQELYKLDPAIRDVLVMRERLRTLPERLKRIVGHDQIKNEFIRHTKNALANLHDGVGPRVSAYIDGPPGTGKTELAIAYAEGMGLPYKIIEMSRFRGDGPNSLGSEDLMSEIAQQLRANQFSVIILDEIEKANPKVLESLLTYMSRKSFTAYETVSGTAKKRSLRVSGKNSSVVMTSNASSDEILEFIRNIPSFDEENRKEILREFSRQKIKKTAEEAGIHGALIDRVKIVSVTLPSTESELREIMMVHFKDKASLIQNNMKLHIDYLGIEDYIDYILEHKKGKELTTRDVLHELKAFVDDRSSDILFHDQYGKTKDFVVNLSPTAIPEAYIVPGNIDKSCGDLFGDIH
jgi:ATP-dependent Clp protease ATP-binding subunit ClpA